MSEVVTLNVNELDTWLQSQPENTVDTPYKLNIIAPEDVWSDGYFTKHGTQPSTMAKLLRSYPDIFLDLSETTLTTSGDGIFKGCGNLIVAPSMPFVGSASFEGCSNLKRVPYIGRGSNGHGYWFCFDGCNSLEIIDYCELNPFVEDPVYDFRSFFPYNTSFTMFVPDGYKEGWDVIANGSVNIIEKTVNELITLKQLKKYDQVRVDNMVKKHTTTGSIDENLIFRATQHTFDYGESAFDGLFYEVAPFMESEQIPEGAKLIYNDNGTLKFTDSLPPYSGLQFGSLESVTGNKEWFEGIEWMPETVALSDFNYSTPIIKVGNEREVATQEVQAFVDYRENATDALLDLRSAETAAKLTGGTEGQVLTSNGDGTVGWKTAASGFVLPVGMVVELKYELNPNDLFTGNWIEIGE